MKLEDVEFICPVFLLDGSFGSVIRVDDQRGVVGVQVPGDEDTRWLRPENLRDGGLGGLSETTGEGFSMSTGRPAAAYGMECEVRYHDGSRSIVCVKPQTGALSPDQVSHRAAWIARATDWLVAGNG